MLIWFTLGVIVGSGVLVAVLLWNGSTGRWVATPLPLFRRSSYVTIEVQWIISLWAVIAFIAVMLWLFLNE